MIPDDSECNPPSRSDYKASLWRGVQTQDDAILATRAVARVSQNATRSIDARAKRRRRGFFRWRLECILLLEPIRTCSQGRISCTMPASCRLSCARGKLTKDNFNFFTRPVALAMAGFVPTTLSSGYHGRQLDSQYRPDNSLPLN